MTRPAPPALAARPLTTGLVVRPFPGFAAPEPPPAPLPLGDGGRRARSVATFGGSLVAGVLLTACAVLAMPRRCHGAPRGARLERAALLRARALELREALREEAEEGPRDRRHDGAP